MIITTDILTRLQAACSTDATLLGVVATLFGSGAVLTLHVGAWPVREVAAQDCPLVAFLDAGPAETGRESQTWSWPVEIHVYVCDGDLTETASPPAGTRLLTAAGPVALDTLAAAVRAAVLSAIDAMGLSEESLRIDLEPPTAEAWPRQRATIAMTLTAPNLIGATPALPALPSP
jgi:hypothetical protein